MSEAVDIPDRMCAVLLTGHGDVSRLVWKEDVPVPLPGDGEVLVRVTAAAVNNTDIAVRTGWYAGSVGEEDAGLWTGTPMHFPRIQGADACGRIVATGPGVDAGRIGERVLVEPVFRLPEADGSERFDYFGSERDGAFAQYACVPSVHAHRIDCALDDLQLAGIPCAGAAAENMIQRAGVRAGETVLVTGASGGVGSAAVQLVRRRGASVIAVASAEKADALRALGAEAVIARGVDPGVALDVVIDVAGGDAVPGWLRALRRGGRYAVAGAIAGAEVRLDLRTIYLMDLSLFGCTVLPPGLFADLLGHVARGEFCPPVAAVYPLPDIALAQAEFLRKSHVGKIVLAIPA
jgi:NADPH:quinone reductase-like Zn-dependent oxidoreductase